MRLTRRQLVAGGAVAGLGAVGIYELVDQLSGSPARPAAEGLTPEQHLLQGVRIVEDNQVEVVVPPHQQQLVTARVVLADRKGDLAGAQGELDSVLAKLDQSVTQPPRGPFRRLKSSVELIEDVVVGDGIGELRGPVCIAPGNRNIERLGRTDPPDADGSAEPINRILDALGCLGLLFR